MEISQVWKVFSFTCWSFSRFQSASSKVSSLFCKGWLPEDSNQLFWSKEHELANRQAGWVIFLFESNTLDQPKLAHHHQNKSRQRSFHCIQPIFLAQDFDPLHPEKKLCSWQANFHSALLSSFICWVWTLLDRNPPASISRESDP